MTETVAELEARIKILKAREEEERKKSLAALIPVCKFELLVTNARWDRLIHPDYGVVKLLRLVTNYLDIRPKGWNGDEVSGMAYFYNKKTCDFVASTGGGYIYIDFPEDFAKLSEFLRANPGGGDVTHIMKDVKTRYQSTGKL